MIQAILAAIVIVLLAAYIYSRYDTSAPHYDWLYKKYDDDDDPKPPKCPNCGR